MTAATEIRVPYELAAGTVELRVKPLYAPGAEVTVTVVITASRGAIRGPSRARIVASGISGEALVRELGVTSREVTRGTQATLSLIWDGIDARGVAAIEDDYGLVLDFTSVTGAGTTSGQATSVLHIRTR